MSNYKTVGIIEARMGSSRLPGKSMMKIGNLESILFLINRLKFSKGMNEVIVATSVSYKDDILVNFLMKNKIKFFRGSEDNVLDRVYNASIQFEADIIVELSGDSPFLSNEIIDDALLFFKKNAHLEYLNVSHNYPGGLGFQIFTYKTLKICHERSILNYEKEHVTPYILSNPKLFNSFFFIAPKELAYPEINLLLDENKDLVFLNAIEKYANKKKNICELLKVIWEKKIFKINSSVKRKKI